MSKKSNNVRYPRKTRFKGIWEKNKRSFEANVRVNGKLYPKVFPKTTPIAEIQKWREDMKALYGDPNASSKSGTFGADVEAYLERRSSIASIKNTSQRLRYFVKVFGADRHRYTIKREDVDGALNNLNKRMAPGTVLGYRAVLRAFFYNIDPNRGNPVRGSFHPGTPKEEPRGRDMALIAKAIDSMSDTNYSIRGGRGVSFAKVRARVVAFTGIPPASLEKITPSDLRPNPLAPTSVRVPRRKKGGGVEPRIVPLTAQGSAAFVAFHQANAYGVFNTQGVNIAFKRGCTKVGIDPRSIRLYDARHSFLSHLMIVTGDTETVGRFGLHAKGSRLPARYTQFAHHQVDTAAAAKASALLTAALTTTAPRKRPRKLAEKVSRRGKMSVRKHLRRVS